jgi:hypothetical protein
MRFFVVVLPILLAGCTSLSLPNAPNISRQTDPFPTDYMQVISDWLVAYGENGVLVSEPQLTDPWEITQARSWYVCVRKGQSEEVAFLHDGHVTDTMAGPNQTFCGAAQYQPLAPVQVTTTVAAL